MSLGYAPEVEIDISAPQQQVWFRVQGPLLAGSAHQVAKRVAGNVVWTVCGLRGRKVSPSPKDADMPRCQDCLY